MESVARDISGSPLGDVIERFLTEENLRAPGKRGYASIMRALAREFPDKRPSDFNTPEGVEALAGFMDERWPVPRTFNKSHSVFTKFFKWCMGEGLSRSNPLREIPRRYAETEGREPFSLQERRRILATHPDVRDLVPLRLLIIGVPVGGVRQLRFVDVDSGARTVTAVHARGRAHVTAIDDDAFWSDFAQLERFRDPNPSDYVWARVKTRRYKPRPGDVESLGEGGVLRGDSDTFLRQAETSTGWQKVDIYRDLTRSPKGARDWWIACLVRAEVAEPGTKRGRVLRFHRARYAVGQEAFREAGTLRAVDERLGLVPGTTRATYTNRDRDPLELAIRRVRRLLRQQVSKLGVRARPSKPRTPPECAPVATFLYYLLEERALVELSRVSVEVLRNVTDSQNVAEAAATLRRVVPGRELISLAEDEATKDHPLLHAHSLVAIWGGLERMARDIPEVWRSLRLTAPPAKRRTKPRSSGVDQFEQGFDSIGLSGRPGGQLARNMYEMEQTRNLHVHRQGRADRAFLAACNDLDYSLSDPVLVTRDIWHDFMLSALLYTEHVLTRINTELRVRIGPLGTPPPVKQIRFPRR